MKDIENYEGLYAITEDGQVFSYKSNKFLKPVRSRNEYWSVSLSKNGERKSFYLHRLTAQTFIANPNNLPCVNHKDENKQNNSVSNLEWCTYEYNNNYGTHNERAAKARSKPVYCLELDKTFESATEAARQLRLYQPNITACCLGKRKTTGNYHFKYIEE